MKTIVATKSGSPDVLELREAEKPVPDAGEVLIKVHAATVTAGDVVLRKMHPLLFIPLQLFGLRRKRTPGHEFAGEVEAVGNAVTHFHPGQAVFGTTTGLSVGANAEYVCLPENGKSNVMAAKPANLSYEQAAAVPVGGMTALYILKKADIRPGNKVLVYGASGSVGTYAVQLARHFGAEVTGVCSTRNLDLVRSIGAERVIDYTQDDFAANGETYDVIFDAVGKIDKSKAEGSLREGGAYLSIQTTTRETLENLLYLKELLEDDAIRPVIDRRFPLEQTAEAHRYVEKGRKTGNVVIAVSHNGQA